MCEEKIPCAGHGAGVFESGLEVAVHQDCVELATTKGGFDPALYRYASWTSDTTAVVELDADVKAPIRAKRKWFNRIAIFLTLNVLLALIVMAAVLGRRIHSSSPPVQPTSTASTATPQKPSATGASQTQATSSTPEIMLAATLNNSTSLASVGFDDQNGILQFRVYFQDSTNYIRESSWNGSDQTWYVSNPRIGQSRSGAPLAATVSWNAHVIPTIVVSSITDSGQVALWTSTDLVSWNNTVIDTQEIQVAPFSKLSIKLVAPFPGAAGPSLIFVYQDTNHDLKMCNITGASTNISTIPANPISGSGLAIAGFWSSGLPQQLRLFYQLASGSLVVADWVSATQISDQNIVNASTGWNLHEGNPLGNFSLGGTVSALSGGQLKFCSYSYGNVTNTPGYVDGVASGANGVMTVPWNVGASSTFSPASYPSALANVDAFTPLASHDWGSLYAVRDGAIVEFTGGTTNNWVEKGPIAIT